MSPELTIFTPIFNRAYIVRKLYNSLCNQTNKDFEWVVVDDGSSDNIDELMKALISENIIRIRYIKQPNQGKHIAVNLGIRNAKGRYFIIVDSDDYLTEDAVEWIIKTMSPIAEDNCFAGISGIRIHPDGTKIGEGDNFGTIDTNALDIRMKYDVKGDLAEVFKTAILKNYPFPEFENEKFCPEALVWNRIADKYNIRYCHKGMYVCEYLSDGLTAKITQLRRKSPRASMTYYSELYHKKICIREKLKAAINFWRFALVSYVKEYSMITIFSLIAWLPGKILAFRDSRS